MRDELPKVVNERRRARPASFDDPRLPRVSTDWLEGLPRRAARVVLQAGLHSRAEVKAAIEDGRLAPSNTVGLGASLMPQLCEWAGTEVPPVVPPEFAGLPPYVQWFLVRAGLRTRDAVRTAIRNGSLAIDNHRLGSLNRDALYAWAGAWPITTEVVAPIALLEARGYIVMRPAEQDRHGFADGELGRCTE